ncbi:putative PEP-binding protein, partial [Shewanella algae]|uniref:putative PEP-binding protein n=1 Tax=Shewanella algae TaxID=38313 RepID=UPI00313EB0BE
EIYQMQARAIAEAACTVIRKDHDLVPEIMIPLVGMPQELSRLKALVEEEVFKVQKSQGLEFPILVGTMIELPRAAL